MTKKQVVAIIPARGGSKGIPKKNITALGGRPLIAWTIEAALQSECIDEVYVSSECLEILAVAKACGARTIKRPETLAQDETLTVPVLKHALKTIDPNRSLFGSMVLLQPTSPFRTSAHIDAAFQELNRAKASSLISVVELGHSPLKSFMLENGKLKGVVNDEYPFMRRQDLPSTYLANGAIYVVETECFYENTSLMTNFCIPFLMGQESSIDIDNPFDLEKAELIIKQKTV